MSGQDARRINRRMCLSSLCGAGMIPLSGCLGGSLREEEPLEFDRPTDSSVTCHERVLVDRGYRFSPRLSPIGDTGATWSVELERGDAVKLAMYWWGERNRVMPLPDLTLINPSGTPILEKSDYSTNIHRVEIQDTGTHELQVQNRHRSEGGEWKVEVTWYSDIDCA